jgi:sec-independent protein translocase protein TatC
MGCGRIESRPAGMYLLKKVIQIREKSHPDHEKPFLEHLEDLRVMITRIVLTLLISTIGCFMIQEQLMHLLRKPVEEVYHLQVSAKLPAKGDAPKSLTVELWSQAKSLEHAAMSLEPEQRELFYQACGDPELVFHAKSVGLLRAALAVPEEKRDGFIKGLRIPEDLRKQVIELVKLKPSTENDNRDNLLKMSALKPTETFMLSMKLSLFAGIIVAFPLLLMFILQFVLPGLHAHEKKVLWPAMAVGFGLFLLGVCFAYFGVLPRALLFFSDWSGGLGVSNDWRIGEYISFATQFTLLFGVAFELPVVVMVFVKLGLLTYETMSNTRSYAIVAIFVAAAVLTPTPDIATLLLMALPMIVLYEICIWLAWLDRRKNRVQEEQEAREREERLLLGTSGAAVTATAVDPFAETPDHDETPEPGDDGWSVESPDPYVPEELGLPDPDEEPSEKPSNPDKPNDSQP